MESQLRYVVAGSPITSRAATHWAVLQAPVRRSQLVYPNWVTTTPVLATLNAPESITMGTPRAAAALAYVQWRGSLWMIAKLTNQPGEIMTLGSGLS